MPRTTADQVVREILRQAGKDGLGKLKLFKAFYFAHVNYAKKRPEMLTSWPIAHLPKGPGPDGHDKLLGGLQADGSITMEHVIAGPNPEHRFRLGVAVGGELAGEALEAIRDAVAFCKDKPTDLLSKITHDKSRSWNQTKIGEIMEATLDAIPDDEYELNELALDQISDIFGKPKKEVVG